MAGVQEVLDVLENIFASNDTIAQLPTEAVDFKMIDKLCKDHI